MLSDLVIKRLPLPDKRTEIPDRGVDGLYLIVQPWGAKSWAVRYRLDGKPRKATLGRYPAIDLATARKRAQQVLDGVAGGEDPRAVKEVADSARKGGRKEPVGAVERVGRRARPERNAKDKPETEGVFIKKIASPWGGRALSQVSRAEVHEVLDAILDRGAPIRGNRLFAQLIRNWAVSHGIAAPSPETRSGRVLSDDEIRLAWNAFGSVGWPFGPIGKLLLLTGARRDEIGLGRWGEIDFGTQTWTIAKERAEHGVAREIPLSDAAMNIIKSLPHAEGADSFVFSASGRTAVSGYPRAKAAIDKAILGILRERAEARGDDPASVRAPAPWTLQDLRRTVAANLQRLGIKLQVTEAVLDDLSESRARIPGAFPGHEFSAEKRIALAVWANRLDAIIATRD